MLNTQTSHEEMKRQDVLEMVSALYPGSYLAGASSAPSPKGFTVDSFGPRLSSFEGQGLDAKEICVISDSNSVSFENATLSSLGIRNPANCLLVVLDESNADRMPLSFKYDGLEAASVPLNPFGPVVEVRHPLEFKKELQSMRCGTLVVKIRPESQKVTPMIETSDFI
ncbi:hypothetical protein MsAg5_03940 [Methanosarcinaceae archaeon Ag5]|uniref:Uncharacterized protein n=1 Tax=Methanolapillus africanus TaxID=3028297 RepID=A0AAE4MI04_9EURY|nr:hypothetical protein [Methanosarcinaceae archaeon Ag5]